MKQLAFAILSLFVLSSCTFVDRAIGADNILSFDQLIERRVELNGKRVTVTGYFDAKESFLLRERGSEYNPVAVDLTGSKASPQKKEDLSKSGFVQINGKFEYVGAPKIVGSALIAPGGFRGGGVSMQISEIAEFSRVPKPKR